jgi:hypothetical protein
MDIIKILQSAVDNLPKGEYSTGLQAILRHLDSAIRHYNRDPLDDPDCYTDSIYRTNQAYEGGLKEAFRILAKKDPSKETPNDIEKYLENNKVVRPRVITQLSRYRQDYRNPSTHDYKLDFDSNEALLAIVSVAAFCKLLVDQISERVAFDSAANQDLSKTSIPKFVGPLDALSLAQTVRNICNNDDHVASSDADFDGYLAGSLASTGLDVDTNYESDNLWDIVVSSDNKKFVIETRKGDGRHHASRLMPFSYLSDGVNEEGLDGGLIVLRTKQRGHYAVFRVEDTENLFYLITRLDKKSIENKLSKLWTVSIPE